MDKKGDKKDAKAGDKKDAKAGDKKQQAPPKEEKKEETNEERRLREEKEALREERKLHKKEQHKKAHEAHAEAAAGVMEDLGKKQAFKKYSYRGNDLAKLLSLDMDQMSKLFRSRQRRRLRRKMGAQYARFLKKLVEAKKECPQGEKPHAVKTHLRDCIVLPSMIQSVINIHNGKGYNNVEVKPEMIGYYLGEFAMSYKRVMHGKPGVGATHSSKFVPIK